MKAAIDYTDWHIPIEHDDITLREAHHSLEQVGAEQQEVPLMVKLVENPNFKLPGITIFHGAVDLVTHDYIHIILGRGLLPADESFTIGFTMGSTGKVSNEEAELFGMVSKYLYPKSYKFRDRDLMIFRDALHLAMLCHCAALDEVDYSQLLDHKLSGIRQQLQIDPQLLIAYYRIEKRLYPDSKASQRLLQP